MLIPCQDHKIRLLSVRDFHIQTAPIHSICNQLALWGKLLAHILRGLAELIIARQWPLYRSARLILPERAGKIYLFLLLRVLGRGYCCRQ